VNNERINERVLGELRKEGLPAENGAYVLNREFTPNFSTMLIELASHAGLQLRIVGSMVALAELPYMASDEQIDAATRKALRTLMKGMHEMAKAWLDANPETPPADPMLERARELSKVGTQ